MPQLRREPRCRNRDPRPPQPCPRRPSRARPRPGLAPACRGPGMSRQAMLVRATAATAMTGPGPALGLRAGWNEREHAAFGFPFPQTKERMSLLEEQLAIIHAVWTEERASFAGAHYRLDDAPAQPKPLQKPHPPLLLGGDAGPRASA